MSTLVVDTLTNQEPQLCKAWVNFNGTGTVAIRASYNVSSITDNGTGDYTINFANAMVDTNYVAFVSNQGNGNWAESPMVFGNGYSQTPPTTTAFKVQNLSSGFGSYMDIVYCTAAVFGN